MESLSVFQLFYAIGEMLTMTWPGRLAPGMVVDSMIARLARA